MVANIGRKKFQTPAPLREDNVTPLSLSMLDNYINSVADVYLTLAELRANQKNKPTIVQAGTRVAASTPAHPSKDEIDVLSQRDKTAEEMLKLVNAALKLAKKTKLKLPPDSRRKKDGIFLKGMPKIRWKTDNDYQGDISRVVDMVRCTLLCDDVNDIQLLSEIFRPCAEAPLSTDVNYEVVRYRNEFNRINPEKGGIRRIQLNIAFEDAGGHVGEILVFYGPSSEKYDVSRKEYGHQAAAEEGIRKSIERSNDHKVISKLSRKVSDAKNKRRKANDEAADFPQVRALTMNQRAYEINQFPVIINEDAHQGITFALVPNPLTGFWETDQRFLDIIENPRDYPSFNISESNIPDAVLRAEALCHSTSLKRELKKAKPDDSFIGPSLL